MNADKTYWELFYQELKNYFTNFRVNATQAQAWQSRLGTATEDELRLAARELVDHSPKAPGFQEIQKAIYNARRRIESTRSDSKIEAMAPKSEESIQLHKVCMQGLVRGLSIRNKQERQEFFQDLVHLWKETYPQLPGYDPQFVQPSPEQEALRIPRMFSESSASGGVVWEQEQNARHPF